jgi:hypothetical protein
MKRKSNEVAKKCEYYTHNECKATLPNSCPKGARCKLDILAPYWREI